MFFEKFLKKKTNFRKELDEINDSYTKLINEKHREVQVHFKAIFGDNIYDAFEYMIRNATKDGNRTISFFLSETSK